MKVIPPTTLSNTEGTFTRGSTATFIGSDGLLQTASNNVLRVQYNSAGECTGHLLENIGTNLLLRSQEFDNIAWVNKTGATVTSNSSTAPDGTLTADTLVSIIDGGSNTAFVDAGVLTVTAGITYTFSVYLKAGTAPTSAINFYRNSPFSQCTATVTWSSKTIVGTGADLISSTIVPLINDWVRVSLTMNSGTSVGMVYRIYVRDQGTTNISGETCFVWGAQLETGTAATSYIPTTTVAVTRSADVVGGTTPCLNYSTVTNTYSGTVWSSGSAYAVGAIVSRTTTNSTYRCISAITAATVPSTTFPEDSILSTTPYWTELGPPLWVSGTNYTIGQKVILASTNRLYQCILTLTAGPANTTAPNIQTANWTDIGPSIRFAAFDLLRTTPSKAQSSMTFMLKLGKRADAIALVGLKNAQKVNVSVSVNGVTVYSSNRSLDNREVLNWYDYFFDPITYTPSIVLLDLPLSIDSVVVVHLTGENIECGGCVLGKQEDIGIIQRNATNDVLNFSSVTRDVFGNATMVPRRNVPKTNQTLYLDKSQVNTVRTLRDSLNAVPAVWVGLEDTDGQDYFESLLIVGFYRTFSIDLDNPIGVFITLELEEV